MKVGGSWIASSLIAGVADDGYGNADDVKLTSGVTDKPGLVSKIARVTIVGTGAAGDRFAFEAQQIGAFKVAGQTVALKSGPANNTSTTDPLLAFGTAGDTHIREIPL